MDNTNPITWVKHLVDNKVFESAVINKGWCSLDLTDKGTVEALAKLTTEEAVQDFELQVFLFNKVPPNIKLLKDIHQSPGVQWSTSSMPPSPPSTIPTPNAAPDHSMIRNNITQAPTISEPTDSSADHSAAPHPTINATFSDHAQPAPFAPIPVIFSPFPQSFMAMVVPVVPFVSGPPVQYEPQTGNNPVQHGPGDCAVVPSPPAKRNETHLGNFPAGEQDVSKTSMTEAKKSGTEQTNHKAKNPSSLWTKDDFPPLGQDLSASPSLKTQFPPTPLKTVLTSTKSQTSETAHLRSDCVSKKEIDEDGFQLVKKGAPAVVLAKPISFLLKSTKKQEKKAKGKDVIEEKLNKQGTLPTEKVGIDDKKPITIETKVLEDSRVDCVEEADSAGSKDKRGDETDIVLKDSLSSRSTKKENKEHLETACKTVKDEVKTDDMSQKTKPEDNSQEKTTVEVHGCDSPEMKNDGAPKRIIKKAMRKNSKKNSKKNNQKQSVVPDKSEEKRLSSAKTQKPTSTDYFEGAPVLKNTDQNQINPELGGVMNFSIGISNKSVVDDPQLELKKKLLRESIEESIARIEKKSGARFTIDPQEDQVSSSLANSSAASQTSPSPPTVPELPKHYAQDICNREEMRIYAKNMKDMIIRGVKNFKDKVIDTAPKMGRWNEIPQRDKKEKDFKRRQRNQIVKKLLQTKIRSPVADCPVSRDMIVFNFYKAVLDSYHDDLGPAFELMAKEKDEDKLLEMEIKLITFIFVHLGDPDKNTMLIKMYI